LSIKIFGTGGRIFGKFEPSPPLCPRGSLFLLVGFKWINRGDQRFPKAHDAPDDGEVMFYRDSQKILAVFQCFFYNYLYRNSVFRNIIMVIEFDRQQGLKK